MADCLCRVLRDRRFICMYHQMKQAGYDKPNQAADEWLYQHDITARINPQLMRETDKRDEAILSVPRARLVPFGLMNMDIGLDTEYMMSEVLKGKRHWSRFPMRTSDVEVNITHRDAQGNVKVTGPRGGVSRTQFYERIKPVEEKLVGKANRMLNLKQFRNGKGKTLGERVNLGGGKQD